MKNLKSSIEESIEQIKKIADNALPKAGAELAALVFESMGTEPTNRGWTENSENTKKKVGVMGKFHRNVDTGFLAEYASTEGVILEDDWLNKMPESEKYKYANELGKFDDIGRTTQDEEFMKKIIEEELKKALS